MAYSVLDLGYSMMPGGISNLGDIILLKWVTGSEWTHFVRLVDGTLITLPSEFKSVLAINNERVVLVSRDEFDYALYNLETSAIEPIVIPGYPAIAARALNNSGDVIGSAGRSWSVLDDFRGFIFNRGTQVVTWVLPTLPSPLPGSTTFVDLNDINDLGHATGVQGWELGLQQLEVPVFYDGTNLRAIGNPIFISNGIRISNDDRVRVWFDQGLGADAIYDATTNTLTPFPNGRIVDLNANGQILWEESFKDHLTSGGVDTAISGLFPSKSRWSLPVATHMNDSGAIVGWGRLQSRLRIGPRPHGFLLTPPPVRIPRDRLDQIIAIILWGVINCGPGVAIIGGHLVRIPPRGPLKEILAALPDTLRDELTPVIREAQFTDPAGARAFRRRVASAVANYSRRTFGRS
jgi:hypothetical protein